MPRKIVEMRNTFGNKILLKLARIKSNEQGNHLRLIGHQRNSRKLDRAIEKYNILYVR